MGSETSGLRFEHHRPRAETRGLWGAASDLDTLERARERASHVPAMGRYIAAIEIMADGPVQYEQTGSDPHHFTVWGSPARLLAQVVSIVPV